MEIIIIVAIGKDGAIGRDGNLIWKISEDLKRFRQLTMGHPVIMGRKTWESLPKRPLPGRMNIVVSRNAAYKAEGGVVCASPEDALSIVSDDTPFIIGGEEIYKLFLPLASTIFLTEIDGACEDADAYLKIRKDEWEKREAGEWKETPEGIHYRYVELKRKNQQGCGS